MFTLLEPDHIQELYEDYYSKLEQATLARHYGNLDSYSACTKEAEQIRQQITELEQHQN
ncbi:MAG: Lacal_2735 family protein [Gammaproteobacteria bacterium]|nr:Lacal_2735 family protein [Gammaproteobacteria bacterium]